MRQMVNNIEVVGKIKTINLQETTIQDGSEVMRGDIVIEVTNEHGYNEIRFDVFTRKYTKQGGVNTKYTAMQTVKNEYVKGDSVRVLGQMGFNEYNHKTTGDYILLNKPSLNFISRIGEEVPESSKAEFEMLIIEVKEPTQELKKTLITGVNVGWNDYLTVLHELTVMPELYTQVKDHYKVNETVKVQCDIINKVEEVVEDISPAGVFGNVEPTIIRNYERENRIVGGFMPYKADEFDDKGLALKVTETEITNILQARKTAVQGLVKPVTSDFAATDMPFNSNDIPF